MKAFRMLFIFMLIIAFICSVSINIYALSSFADVPEDAWYAENVQYVYDEGLMNGISETEFDPTGTLTRAMFVTILGRMTEIDPQEYIGSVFKDVPENIWYAPYVTWALRDGITNGKGDGEFDPLAPILRQDVAVMVTRFLNVYCEYSIESTLHNYSDISEIAEYARLAVARCYATGIMKGDDNNRFRPTDYMTRAEATAVCRRLAEYMDLRNMQSDELNEDKNEDNDINDSNTTGSWFGDIVDGDDHDITVPGEQVQQPDNFVQSNENSNGSDSDNNSDNAIGLPDEIL